MAQMASSAQLHSWSHAIADEARAEIFDAVGDLSGLEIVGSQVLLACYLRPTVKRLAGGGALYIPKSVVDEDGWQGKVLMILKFGHAALPAPDDPHRATFLANWGGRLPTVGDFVFTDVKLGFPLSVKGPGAQVREDRTKIGDWDPREGWKCRLAFMKDLFGRVASPEVVV